MLRQRFRQASFIQPSLLLRRASVSLLLLPYLSSCTCGLQLERLAFWKQPLIICSSTLPPLISLYSSCRISLIRFKRLFSCFKSWLVLVLSWYISPRRFSPAVLCLQILSVMSILSFKKAEMLAWRTSASQSSSSALRICSGLLFSWMSFLGSLREGSTMFQSWKMEILVSLGLKNSDMINQIKQQRTAIPLNQLPITSMAHKHEQCLFEQILAKFIINLPPQEQEDSNRLAYQSEKAFYYYIDVILNNSAPDHWEQLRNQFLAKLAQHAPPSLRIDPRKILMKLQENKPVCGALIFNKDDSKVLVVRTRNKFGFPKGKWNQHETARECAAREVQEETGIYIHNRMDPNIQLSFESHGNSTTFFVARGVSEEERLRMDFKEIDEIFWMRVEDIEPNWRKIAEKSRMAWQLYLKAMKKSDADLSDFQKFMDRYKTDYQNTQVTENPFLTFKFDYHALKNALLSGM